MIKEPANTHENKKGWGRFAPGRKNQKPDALDKKLIYLLTLDGRMSVRAIAKSLEITPPTARSRMEALIRSGILRIAGLVDPFTVKGITTAIVGVRLALHEQLDEKIEQISNLHRVNWAAVVTGRFDIIVEVIMPDGMPGLYQFLTEDLPQVGGIQSSESFMVMKAKRKWILLPPAMKHW